MTRIILAIAGMFTGIWLVSAWSMCVTIGIIHDSYWSFIPLMGHGAALAIAAFEALVATIILIVTVLLGGASR